MQQLEITYKKTTELSFNPRNARKHDRRQIGQIRKSIETFGFSNPLLADEHDVLIAGHGRLQAARDIGLKTVPVIVLQGLSDTQKRALLLADNKIALNASWDMTLLAEELSFLTSMDLEIDAEISGFEVGEIDVIMGAADNDADGQEELAPLPNAELPAITRRGDVWMLGDHRIICGDARSRDDLKTLFAAEQASMIFTDPPYNVKIDGHVCGNGKTRHREFLEASGEMTPSAFTEFLDQCLTNASQFTGDGAVSYVCMHWKHMSEVLNAGQNAFGDLLNLCVWTKTNGGMGSLYRSQHELVFVFRNGQAQHRNNVQLGRFGRNRTNVWRYPGVNVFREGRMEELTAHPTPKPVAMTRDAILDVTRRGDIVLDPFLGGGATLIAAEQSGRVAYGIEIDPLYVDVVLRRWRKETGLEPTRGSDKRTLASLESAQQEHHGS